MDYGLPPWALSVTKAALALGVSRKTLSKIVNGNAGISPEMAFRLSIAFGGSPESWMGHQVAYDLWHVEQHKGLILRKLAIFCLCLFLAVETLKVG